MAKKREIDTVMSRVRNLHEKSGLSLHHLGLKMGYPEESARKSAWQFMKTEDPRLSMLRRFAKAVGVSIVELVAADGSPSGTDTPLREDRPMTAKRDGFFTDEELKQADSGPRVQAAKARHEARKKAGRERVKKEKAAAAKPKKEPRRGLGLGM